MMIFKLASFLVVFGVTAYIGWVMFQDFRNTPPDDRDSFQELLRLGAGSLTKVWLRLVALVSGAMSAVGFMIPALQMPEAQAAIQKYLPAESVTAVILAIALIGLITRSRTSDDGRLL